MTEPLDPKKYHILSAGMTKKLSIIAAIFVLVIFPIVAVNYYKIAINRPSPLDREITFEIKSGEGVAEISKGLYEAGALNSEFLFSFYVFLNKLDRNIQAGVYTIPAGSSIVVLAEQFQHGVNDMRVTFLEGWRVEEFARVAAKQFAKIDYAEFVRKAQPYEGYLFPDTYYFDNETREDEMIGRLRETFDSKTQELLTDANLARVGLTKDQVVTLASIVEREVNNEEDRRIVAGILINRYKNEISLGADATTQYAVAPLYLCGRENLMANTCTTSEAEINAFEWWKKDITLTDLEYDSPFNTRKVLGLPPHPISSTSLSAIDAVINYEDTAYVFYLTDNYGNTHYAETLEQHNANVAEYLQ